MSLSILNVGEGDTKLSFDPNKPGDRERCAGIVRDMLSLGYAILIKVGEVWQRCKRFDPERCEYLIEDAPAKKPGRSRRLPARGTPAVAVARSAGGMSNRADSIEARNQLERVDRFSNVRNNLRRLAAERALWAGIPMPLEGEQLVVEPTYPGAQVLGRKVDEDADYKIINRWYDAAKRRDIIVFEHNGKRDWGVLPAAHSMGVQARTMGVSVAWGIEQEHNALKTLAELLPHHLFKGYLLTGMFPQTSKRSGVTYIFRKLRPTVACVERDDDMKILAALCMHPIAYYDGSWGGAMCPTDDVIAHLMLMRGDEAMFWKRCNQHPAWRPEAGL